MKRRQAILGLAALCAAPAAFAQSSPKLRRVGFLAVGNSASASHLLAAPKKGMSDLGWQEGRNVEYLVRYAESRVERLDGLCEDLVRENVDVILAGAPQIALAAQKATRTIPIVMANVSNAVENKFVASLAKPGGNITGVTSQLETVLGKMIEILHEVIPRATRYAILLNESNPTHSAPSPATFRSSSRQNSSWSSTSRLQRRWGSRSRSRSCCGRTG